MHPPINWCFIGGDAFPNYHNSHPNAPCIPQILVGDALGTVGYGGSDLDPTPAKDNLRLRASAGCDRPRAPGRGTNGGRAEGESSAGAEPSPHCTARPAAHLRSLTLRLGLGQRFFLLLQRIRKGAANLGPSADVETELSCTRTFGSQTEWAPPAEPVRMSAPPRFLRRSELASDAWVPCSGPPASARTNRQPLHQSGSLRSGTAHWAARAQTRKTTRSRRDVWFASPERAGKSSESEAERSKCLTNVSGRTPLQYLT